MKNTLLIFAAFLGFSLSALARTVATAAPSSEEAPSVIPGRAKVDDHSISNSDGPFNFRGLFPAKVKAESAARASVVSPLEYQEKLVQNIPALKRLEHTAFIAYEDSKDAALKPGSVKDGYLYISFRLSGTNHRFKIATSQLANLKDGDYVIFRENDLRTSIHIDQTKLAEGDTTSVLAKNWKAKTAEVEPQAIDPSLLEIVDETRFTSEWLHATVMAPKMAELASSSAHPNFQSQAQPINLRLR